MYAPRAFLPENRAQVSELIHAAGAGDLVTVSPSGPQATRLPLVWLPEESRIVAHMARVNEHWESIQADAAGLVIVNAPDAYVSPSWYASKAEHGRVVPTWDYGQVQLRGRVRVHHDEAWLRDAVERLTDLHEQPRAEPWALADAPEKYVTGMLRAIVGVEVLVDAIEASLKYSQNKSDADRRGVVTGLRAEGDARSQDVAERVAREG